MIYVRRHGEWYSSALDTAGPEMTTEVQPVVTAGSVGIGWTDATDPHAVVVGIPLPAVDAQYYEVSVAEELDRTLWTLALALAVCAGLTTVAGAVLGRGPAAACWRRSKEVTTAAIKLSAGDLTTRLRGTDDPDLAALVGSFNHMVDALHARIEQDARFAADVSHELRTPVTTLTTSLSLLQHVHRPVTSLGQGGAADGRGAGAVPTGARRSLTLGRLDAGAHDGELSTTGVRELVRQALKVADARTSVSWRQPGGGPDPLVEIDRPQLLRVLTNLFRNADLHGGGLTSCGSSTSETSSTSTSRTAVPASPRPTGRIFERFARAGGQKVGTGSGLGLSIVEQTVRNHGGDVWCADPTGGGAAFIVRLPTVRVES